jgi:indole-3-glycerol phosphate synthase
MGFLTDVTAEIRAALELDPPDEAALRREADRAPAPRDLAEALRAGARRYGVAVIAEVKRASPSAGAIAPEADPEARARAYADADVAAVSVLTEPRHFGGSLDDLRAVRAAVTVPVLRKDFLLEPAQLLEARAAGADAVLLIAACLPGTVLATMLAASRALGMEPLVETHGDEDLERVLATDARIVGVNARDLESLAVDPEAARRRLRRVPHDRLAVLESGIGTRADVASAVEAGASAILVGEALMRAADPASAVRDLVGEGQIGGRAS